MDNTDFFWWAIDRYLNSQKDVKATPLDPTQQATNLARLDLIRGNNPWGQWAMGVAQPFINQAMTMKPNASFMSPELSGQQFANGAGGPMANMPFPGGGGGLPPNPFEANKPGPGYGSGVEGGPHGLPGGRFGNEPLNRERPPDPGDYSGGRAPEFGEGIGDWLTRNPGGNPADYLPGGGAGASYNPDGGVWTTSTGEKLFLPPETYTQLTTTPTDLPPEHQGRWKQLINRGLDLVAKNGVKWLLQGGAGVLTILLTADPVLAPIAARGAGMLYDYFRANPNQTGQTGGTNNAPQPGGST